MKYITANWKMNMGTKEVLSWLENFKNASENIVIVAPSFLHLPLLKTCAQGKNIKLAAQDVAQEERGAYTGRVAAFQLKDMCEYCIVGHSEIGNALEVVIKKRDLCLKNGITPIVCFVSPSDAKKVYKESTIIAWEDPSNISQGGLYKDTDPKEIEKVINDIKANLPKNSILLYGGSVNEQNAKELAKIRNLDGVLVGNASLDTSTFTKIVESF